MSVGYIDTSFLLSIVLEDDNYEKSIARWNSIDTLFSSVLLEIESRINIYKQFRSIKDEKSWLRISEEKLNDLLEHINRRIVDAEIVQEIKNVDRLKTARSLDGIHLATAIILNKLLDEKLILCSYDKRMIEVGGKIGLRVN